MTRFFLFCLAAGLVAHSCAWAQTRAPMPHWTQSDDANRKTLKGLLSAGYEVKAAFVNSHEIEIAYLEKGGSLFRCVVSGGNLELLTENELLCSEFVEPYRTK